MEVRCNSEFVLPQSAEGRKIAEGIKRTLKATNTDFYVKDTSENIYIRWGTWMWFDDGEEETE